MNQQDKEKQDKEKLEYYKATLKDALAGRLRVSYNDDFVSILQELIRELERGKK